VVLLDGYIKKVFESSAYKLWLNFGAKILILKNSEKDLVIFEDNQKEQGNITKEIFKDCIVISRGNQTMIG